MGVPEFIEKNFISGREPQKESVIGCSGLEQALLWQIREPWTGRQQEQSDGMFYVIGGEGRVTIVRDDGKGSYAVAGQVPTAAGARTGYFVPDSGRLYVAVPHRGTQNAEVRAFQMSGRD